MTKDAKWVVHKFGGTSVGNAERYQAVAKIIGVERKKSLVLRQAIVVSAMKGVTDGLIELTELARQRNDSYREKFTLIQNRHQEVMMALGIEPLWAVLEKDFQNLNEVLRGIWHAQSAAERIVEYVSGFGEVWSAQILSAYFLKTGVPSHYLDAREVLVVEPAKIVTIQWPESSKKLAVWFSGHPDRSNGVVVITGFVASTPDGVATTLKRNGSDFSASIFGQLLHASEIFIWTDVDGVLSADPRLVPDAVILHEMTYHEVTELAHFGAKVVHPATMEPAIRNQIPVWIRNTFNPTCAGTKIHAGAKSTATVKGFSAIEKMALINVEGNGLMGVSGVAERLFGALRAAGISVVMISQASSEHSICFAVAEESADAAKAAVENAFFAEIHRGAIDRIAVSRHKSILAAVGDNMVENPGVAGQFFSALGRAGVNIHAIAQGSSERNISAVIEGAETSRALRAVHSAFYLSPQTIGIGIIGTGLIGSEFLKQLKSQLARLKEHDHIDLRVRAVMNSRKMLLDGKEERGLAVSDFETMVTNVNKKGEPANLEKFISHLSSSHLPHSIVIDASASEALADAYPSWLQAGLHIITPNKKANTQSYAKYQSLRQTAREQRRRFFYSTNVGGGLPVIQTLRDLIQTGDQVLKIEGVVSGTLSFLFNSFDGSRAFSEVVKEAKAKGYTEPDPREDLSGMDVARKLVILAREAGQALELSQITIENLVPEKLRKLSLVDYLARIHEGDESLNARLKLAKDQGQVLRYVGRLEENGKASVGLVAVAPENPFAQLQGADNLVAFYTHRYRHRPLVIQGSGAGAMVTAGGVFADLLRLTSTLGAARD